MSQKKRVRVYKPGGNVAPFVNTDHFSNYFFQTGGPVDQGMQQAPMQQGQDQSQDLQNVLMMYAQSKGLAEEEAQQLFQTVLNMQPEEQAQVLAKIQAELTQGMDANPMLERGGYIKQTKKLLNKKIGGIGPNATKDNVIGSRKAIVENAIGDYMMRNINDEVANQQMQEMQQMQLGGMTGQWYGGGMGNAYNEDYQNRRQGMLDDVNEFLGNANDWYSNITPDYSKGFKVKTKGPMFSNPSNVNAQVDASNLNYEGMTSNEAAEQLFGLKNGGYIPSYQDAGTTSIYYDNTVPLNTYLGNSDAMRVTPEGAFPIYESNTKPFIVEKSSKSVLGSPYVDDYGRYKTYQANSKGILESKSDESYRTRNIGGDEVISYPDRYVRMDTLGYSQGRQNFPVVVTEKNIADGFGGSYDVNRFDATREQVPSLIRSMKNQTFQTNAEKVKANADAVYKNALKVEANRRKVLKLAPLTDYEKQQILKGNYENGGSIPSYQPGGQTIDIGTGKYNPATKTITGTDGTTRVVDEDEANWIMSQVQFGNASTNTNNTTSTNTNNTTTSNGNLNGWHGNVFWQNGQAVTTLADLGVAGGGNGFDYNSLFTQGKHFVPANQMANIFTQQGINRLANTFKGMQPDDVYLSKAKAKMGPFGAKAVLKWEYGPDGKPRQVAGTDEDNQSSSRFPTMGGNNIIDRTRARIQSMRTPSTGGDIPVGIDTPVSNATPSPASMQPSMSQSSGSGMGSMEGYDEMGNPITPSTPNPVYAPVQSNPRQSMEDLGEFAIGGRAGKMVIKPGGYNVTGHHFAPFITSGMDAASSNLEIPPANEAMLTADAQVPTMYNNPLGRGLHTEKGPYNVEMTPQLKPLNEGDRFAQGYYEGPYFSKYGGNTYEAGGMTGNFEEGQYYDLDEDAINDIVANGGTIKYINEWNVRY